MLPTGIPTTIDQPETSLQAWREGWIVRQASRSRHPPLFWRIVADRLVVERQQLHCAPTVPLGPTTLERPEVMSFLLQRYQRAIGLELSGNSEALVLHEANVADCYMGLSPYDRLLIIYTHRHWDQDALRVREAFVAQALNPDSNDTIYFRDHAERLAKRLGQSWSQGLVRIL